MKPALFTKFSLIETFKLWVLYFKDPTIIAVRQYLVKTALSTDINLELSHYAHGYDFKVKSFAQWRKFLIQAFDWINIYGMVPWQMIEKEGLHIPEVPEIGTGSFAIIYDSDEKKSYTVWVDTEFKVETNDTFDSLFRKSLKSNYRVTQGTDRNFTATVMSFQSPLASIMEEFYHNYELKDNMLTSDWNASHPVSFVNKEYKKPVWQELTEEQLIDPFSQSTLDYITEQYNKHYEEQLEKLTNMANKPRSLYEMPKVNLHEGLQSVYKNRRFYDMQPLPFGSTIETQNSYTNTADYWKALKIYQTRVCSLFGVSWMDVFANTEYENKPTKQKSTNVVELRDIITNVRKEIDQLVKSIYKNVYSTIDYLETKNNILRLSKFKKELEDNEVKVFIKYLKTNIDNINVPDVVFGHNPFIDDISIEEILSMVEGGLISANDARTVIEKKFDIKFGSSESSIFKHVLSKDKGKLNDKEGPTKKAKIEKEEKSKGKNDKKDEKKDEKKENKENKEKKKEKKEKEKKESEEEIVKRVVEIFKREAENKEKKKKEEKDKEEKNKKASEKEVKKKEETKKTQKQK